MSIFFGFYQVVSEQKVPRRFVNFLKFSAIATVTFDIVKFNEGGDFTLSTKKSTNQAILSSRKVLKAIEDPKELPATMTNVDKHNKEETAYETLGNNFKVFVVMSVELLDTKLLFSHLNIIELQRR